MIKIEMTEKQLAAICGRTSGATYELLTDKAKAAGAETNAYDWYAGFDVLIAALNEAAA